MFRRRGWLGVILGDAGSQDDRPYWADWGGGGVER